MNPSEWHRLVKRWYPAAQSPGYQPRRGRREQHRLTLEILEARTLPGFLAPISSATAQHPEGVAVADLNGDGIPDVVAAGVYGGVTVFLGNGDGTLKPGVYHSGFSSYGGHVVVGDFNGDGVPDLAVAGADEVGVFLGNGDGTFQAPFISYNTPSFDLAMGDFNGDGLPDLAVTSYRAAGTVSILLNDGNWSAGPGGAPHRLAPARHAALASVLMTAAQSPNRTTFPSILVSAEHQPQPKPVTRDIDTSRPASRSVAATLEHRITIRYAEDTASEGWENIAPELPALS